MISRTPIPPSQGPSRASILRSLPPAELPRLDLVLAAFVTVLLCANLIGASKRAILWLPFGAGVLFFSITTLLDVLTAVYGTRGRGAWSWAGFVVANLRRVHDCAVPAFPRSRLAPPAAFETVFAGTPRIVLASLAAYFCGEFCNPTSSPI